MSRRIKLLILAVFLLLLAIPAAYVAFTWSTPNPLRFHIVAYHPPSSPEAWPAYGKLELRIENTSHLPVHLFIPGLARADWSPGRTELRGTIPPSLGMDTFLPIPPGHSISFPCRIIPGDENPPFTWENAEVRYQWISGTRRASAKIWNWLGERLPKRVMEHLPYPDFITDTTELMPAHR